MDEKTARKAMEALHRKHAALAASASDLAHSHAVLAEALACALSCTWQPCKDPEDRHG